MAIKDIAREPTARIMVTLTVVAESSKMVYGGCASVHVRMRMVAARAADSTLLFCHFRDFAI